MSVLNYSIREAKASDISTILELIQLKALFDDGSPASVEATAEKLKNTLFGENPLAQILLAKIDSQAVGFASYYRTYSTFLAQPGIWLDDLFVNAEYRGCGIGEALIQHLCQIAQTTGCSRIDWTVAVANPRGIKFYQRLGAKLRPDLRLCRLDRQAIAQLGSA